MMNIDLNKLNPLEQRIFETLAELSKRNQDITINQAAEACHCSVSKISKFVKKLGFGNYRQYMEFLCGKEPPRRGTSMELERIKCFIDDFETTLVDEFIALMNSHEKIILFGYGPSFICAQYFEYKLRNVTSKTVIAVPDEISVENSIDGKSLLVIFSATGRFRSFESLYASVKKRNGRVLLIIEEYNPSLLDTYDRIFWLSKFSQPEDLKPHEKSRTVFFIFIEEVIQRIMSKSR
jgi:DNA-binding MurR/RpiR family transcriptional regulator